MSENTVYRVKTVVVGIHRFGSVESDTAAGRSSPDLRPATIIPIVEIDPLHDYIDPEILNKLDDMKTDGDWRVTFPFGDYQVRVTHDSQVFVDGELYRPDTD